MDHLFVSVSLATNLSSCTTGEHARVFEASLSDHLPIVADFTEDPRSEVARNWLRALRVSWHREASVLRRPAAGTAAGPGALTRGWALPDIEHLN
jgi:hypothetical protein